MRIKKTSQTTTISAQVINTYSDSTEDTYSCDYVNRFGKLLWRGSFITGSINVPGLTDYSVILVQVQGAVYCLGSRYYGAGGIGTYGGYAISQYGYRLGGTGTTMEIDSTNKGGSDGTQQQPITAIYGLF